MSDEAIDSPEVITAPAEAETAPTEQETTPEPVNDDTADSTEEKKPGRAEQRIQQLVGDRNNAMDFAKIAEQQRDFYKQQLDALSPKAEPAKALAQPKLEDFDHDLDKFMVANDSYYAQVIDQKVSTGINQGLASFQKQAAQEKLSAEWKENEAQFVTENPDYNQVAFATESMMQHIEAKKDGPAIAYWLGQNPAEAQRIGSLPVSQQGFELGKIKLSPGKPSAKQKTTQAPEPPSPVGGAQPDTSIANESIDDYMKRMNAKDRERRAGRR